MFNIFGSKNKDNIDTVEPIPQKYQTNQPESSSENFLTIGQVTQLVAELDDNEILLYIKEQLNIDSEDEIDVTGELSATYNQNSDSYHYRIYNVKSKIGEQIEYPINDLDKKDSIRENGIYVPYAFNKALKAYVNTGAKVLVKCKLA